MSQNSRVLSYLKQGGSITPLRALKVYGCMRLARVINDLRNDGFDITTTMVGKGRSQYASYSMGSK